MKIEFGNGLNIESIDNNHIRSKRSQLIVNTLYDKPVSLIRKTDNKLIQGFFKNVYGKVYYFSEDDNITFLSVEGLKKYNVIQDSNNEEQFLKEYESKWIREEND